VWLNGVEFLICLPVPLGDASINVSANDEFVEVCPTGDNSLGAAIIDDSGDGLIGFYKAKKKILSVTVGT
jgi:hypothetical protein